MAGQSRTTDSTPSPDASHASAMVRLVARVHAEPSAATSRNAQGSGGWVGVVEGWAAGSSSLDGWRHRRVVITPHASCGVCERCKSGLSRHCREAADLVTPTSDPNQKVSQGAIVSVPARQLLPVPDGLRDDWAACAVPIASVMHAARSVRRSGSGFVTVIGDRPESLMWAKWLVERVPSVRLLTESDWSQRIADQWGIKHRPRAEAGRREDQETVIVDAVDDQAFLLALRLVRPCGTVILASPPKKIGPAIHEVVDRELTVIGAGGPDAGTVAEAMRVLARGSIDLAPLITNRHRFEADRGALPASHAATSVPSPSNGWTLLEAA